MEGITLDEIREMFSGQFYDPKYQANNMLRYANYIKGMYHEGNWVIMNPKAHARLFPVEHKTTNFIKRLRSWKENQ